MTDIVEGTVVEETGTDIVPAAPPAQAPSTLFRTDDPVEVVEKASRVADALKGVLEQQGLTKRIGAKNHVLVEGWTTLGSMLGVVPVVVWTRRIEDGWEARVEARTLAGNIVGAAEAECLKTESHWRNRDDYALRSMAQTRATSKALRGPLGFIVTLAGYDATPSEEMPERRDVEATGASDVPADPPIKPERYQELVELFRQAGTPADWLAEQLDTISVDPATSIAHRVATLTDTEAQTIEALLRERIAAAAEPGQPELAAQ